MPWLNVDEEEKRCYMTHHGYLGFMTGNPLPAIMTILMSRFQQCDILRQQEVHIGKPECMPC